jgi:hypothetical protein
MANFARARVEQRLLCAPDGFGFIPAIRDPDRPSNQAWHSQCFTGRVNTTCRTQFPAMAANKISPGHPHLDKPANVEAMVNEAGAIVIECDAVPKATGYIWSMRVPADPEARYRVVARSKKPFTWINAPYEEHTVEIVVQAQNRDGEGAPSDRLQITFPGNGVANAGIPPAVTENRGSRSTRRATPAAGARARNRSRLR